MKKKMICKLCVCFSVLAILVPFLFLLGVIFVIPSQYSLAYYGGLNEKYDRLYGLEEPKIVVVGGSSVAFGMDSAMLEKYMGMPVVNFGLYAELGTKLMLDLSRDAIGEGDIVIISPEINAQTLSLYFNGEATLKAVDDDKSMLLKTTIDDFGFLYGGSWSFATEKLGFYLRNDAPDPAGIYNSKNLNEYGDIIAGLRDANVMTGFFSTDNAISLDPSDYAQDFIDYLNEYIRDCKKAGATVYYTFCPMNEWAIGQEVTERETTITVDGDVLYKDTKFFDRYTGERLDALADTFYQFVTDTFDCEILGMDVRDYIMDPGYFYDSNFHLNDRGVTVHTAQMVKDLYNQFYLTDVEITEELQPPLDTTVVPMGEFTVGNLVYQMYAYGKDNPTYGFTVTGVSEVGLTKQTLEVPARITVEHETLGSVSAPVTAVGTEAFFGTTVTKNLVLPPDSCVANLDVEFLKGSSITALYIYRPVEGDDNRGPLLVGTQSFNGAASGLLIHIASDLYSSYVADYFWESFGSSLRSTDLTYEEVRGEAGIAENVGFIMEELPDGTYAVAGITDEASGRGMYIIPNTHNGKAVTAILDGAFAGTEGAIRVVTQPDSALTTIESGAFRDAEVAGLYVYGPAFDVSADLFTGATGTQRVYIHADVYDAYMAKNGWSELENTVKNSGSFEDLTGN